MATLKLENLPPELLSQIEHLAQQNHCSVNQQAIAVIQQSRLVYDTICSTIYLWILKKHLKN